MAELAHEVVEGGLATNTHGYHVPICLSVSMFGVRLSTGRLQSPRGVAELAVPHEVVKGGLAAVTRGEAEKGGAGQHDRHHGLPGPRRRWR